MNEQFFAVFLACATVLFLWIFGKLQDSAAEYSNDIEAAKMAHGLAAEMVRISMIDHGDVVMLQHQFPFPGMKVSALWANVTIEGSDVFISLSLYGSTDKETVLLTEKLHRFLSKQGMRVQTFFYH